MSSRLLKTASLSGIVTSLVIGSLSPGQQPDHRAAARQFELVRSAMGVQLKISVWCPDRKLAEPAMLAAVDRVHQLEQVLSNYRDDSEVARLGAAIHNGPVAVSEDLWEVLQRSEMLWTLSHGSFDVTLGPLTDLWRTALRSGQLPDEVLIAAARESTGFQKLRFDQAVRTISSSGSGLQLDFGGIGKGYAADQALAVLRDRGIRCALVDLGGDMAIGDCPPGRAGWRVAIDPVERGRRPNYYIEVANCGVATSGDKHQFVTIDGRRYSHLVDPATGLGLQRSSRVTVVACDATEADGFASVFTLLEVDESVSMANDRDGLELLGIARDSRGGEERFGSRSFPQLQPMDP